MKTAFTVWNNRIAPVFDVARQIRVVEAECGRVIREDEVVLKEDTAAGKAGELSGLGVNALVCGAISRTMANLVAASGIQVIPFVAGDLREVIDAWIRGGITDGLFVMPGCRGRRRLRGWGAFEQEGNVMKGRKQGGGGRGRGGQ
ncbi:MAG: NifB/NifX family molybdenum-iron cluster-binding protein, partial [Desulfobacterales bacterium]|nr:NifB/NifX family molybdenum-iron cluster-binding protein [Desulfobacterales bacterium]